MRCYLIRDAHITVLAARPKSDPSAGILIQAVKDLDQKRFPLPLLLAIWNALPGMEPVKRFQSRPTAIKRIWAAFEGLPVTSARSDCKQAKLLSLLQQPNGASMQDLMSATGWQAHSVRGALSGVLQKKLGLHVSSSVEKETRIYRISA